MHAKIRKTAIAGLGLILAAVSTTAASEPAVVYDMGGKFDKSFNEAAYNGAERFKKETGISYREFEITSPAQREPSRAAKLR